jgi:predicted nucleic acid-binding protein
MIVVDSSVLVAALLADDDVGLWAAEALAATDLGAPSIAAFESANIIRRHVASGLVDARLATAAHRDLALLTIEYWPYHAVAARCWELRHNLTIYDAAFVAMAEATKSPLYTLDKRLAAASGPSCDFVTPTAS